MLSQDESGGIVRFLGNYIVRSWLPKSFRDIAVRVRHVGDCAPMSVLLRRAGFEFNAWAARAERKKEHAQHKVDAHRWKIPGAPLRKVFLRQAPGPQQQCVHRLPEPTVDVGDNVPSVVKQHADRTGTLVRVLAADGAIRTGQECAAVRAIKLAHRFLVGIADSCHAAASSRYARLVRVARA
jgi:hypothetical protein